jgi:16S rRNA (guanine527-N7)-methyltransferase
VTPEEFAARFDVPRGTVERLSRYADLLADWQQRLNLVSPTSLPLVWDRHFADSAQLARLVPPGLSWLDVGSGGGFPGLVIAAMEHGRVTLVESIAKKCRFLQAVIDDLRLDARVIHGRAETLPSARADVVTARAVAPLDRLFGWTAHHGHGRAQWIFPKGRSWREEVAQARQAWDFRCEAVPSLTDSAARIVVASDLRKKS